MSPCVKRPGTGCQINYVESIGTESGDTLVAMTTSSNRFSSVSTSAVKLLQLTDTHLFADPDLDFDGVRTLESLKEVIAFSRIYHWPPDAVVLTGDLVHDPVKEAYSALKRVLSELGVPTYCIPGNHDDPELMRSVLPGNNVYITKQLLLGNWQLILLNTYVPNSHGGALSRVELDFLEYCLASRREVPSVVCLHHPPVPIDSPWMDAMALRNPDDLFAILEGFSQVRCVLWGHIHQLFEKELRGIKLLGTPSTCIQFKPRTEGFELDELGPGYRWLILHDNGQMDTGVIHIS